LYAYKQASRIRLLESEKRVSEQKLVHNRMQRNLLIGGIMVLVFLGLVIFWNISLKNKNEKLKHEKVEHNLQRRAAELEMQALRAQMNPHFIFNALSSVNRFILKNDPDKASDYLTRFSRLIRLVLVNSQREVIFLEEEIAMLQLYLQMEQLRFKHAFEFTIRCSNEIDDAQITIPPLLVQPFCENAIWHGLMHREEKGWLDISFTKDQNILCCTITDNGVGREKAAQFGSKSAEKIKSLGLQLTRERLALFNEDSSVETSYTIEDIMNTEGDVTGTRVQLYIKNHSVLPEKETMVV
jgi:LytS/YehU family sensor histidine kinase